MKEKGFTLIELLAVIVILAIIALIATPIILGIIKDAKKESDKRSIDLYADALKNSIAQYQLGREKLEVSKLKVKEETQGREFTNTNLKVDYDGNVECDIIEVYANGNIYLDKCMVNGEPIKYEYGKKASFANDSWETIRANVKLGYMYNVGDTKEIKLEGFINEESNSKGLYTVRIANTSTPDECSAEGFSQTACGFVVEFEDIITSHNMNSNSTNVGGYPASEMYKFINEEKDDTTTSIYESLPKELKDVIIDTKVVSSHGNTSGETNFVSIDKLYLLSTKEVWGKKGTSNVINYDTAEAETRQLDYYEQEEVTTSSYSGAIKKYNGSAASWLLRSASSNDTNSFYSVRSDGVRNRRNATSRYWVAPAFRIG